MSEVKTRVEAVPRARGESACFINADRASPFAHFMERFGTAVHDAELPSQSYNESFEQEQHDGTMEADSLARIVSVAGEKASDQVQTCNLPSRSHFTST